MLVDEDFWDDILAHLRKGVLVPVIGPELVTRRNADEPPVTLSQQIGRRLAERYGLTVEWTEQAGLNDAVRAHIARHGRDKSERLYRVVNDILEDLAWAPPEALTQLATISDLRLFVSTTFDSLLGRAINEVRFNGEARARELWFSPNQSTAEQQKNARPPGRDEAVVFKIFGEAASTPQYALHDEDVLEWLHALLAETARLPDWLGYRLKESPLLFIGCDISDWLGRFLIRLTSANRLSLASKQFFIAGTATTRYPAVREFFTTHCPSTAVQVLEVPPADFVQELVARWRKRNPETVGPEPARGRGSIFISYVREDVSAARRLAEALKGLGGDVWLDEQRLQPGDRWEDEILTSIKRDVRLFIPVISAHTEAREEGYVFKEWGEAVARSKGIPRRRFIVPIVIDEAYEGNAARYRQVPREFTDVDFGHAPGGEPDRPLLDMLTEEIRAMRRRDAA